MTPLREWRRVSLGAGVLLFVLGLVLAIVRVAPLGQVGSLRVSAPWVMDDFRHVVYYPSRAFADGINPYDSSSYMTRYPVDVAVSLYAPAMFLLFLPFGLLPVVASSVAYFILTVVLTLVLAWAILRLSGWQATLSAILVVAGLVLLSRPGHWNLLSGQVTLVVVLATYAALRFSQRAPRLAGVGIALAMFKPSFAIPLILILLAQGAGRAVLWGVGLAAALNLPALAILAEREGGLSPFLATLTQTSHITATKLATDATGGVWRVDMPALVSRVSGHPLRAWAGLLVAAAVLLPVMLMCRRFVEWDNSPQQRIPVALVCCGVLLSVYHQAYDLLLLTLPAAGLARALSQENNLFRAIHIAQALLIAFLAINYMATESVLTALQLGPWQRLLVVSANGLAVTGLLGLYLVEARGLQRSNC
jgi:Glycosyltransferase family 87